MENFEIHIGGAHESPKEGRDVIHNSRTLATPFPPSYDADFSKVLVQMQYKLGICTAEAVCSLIERFRNDGVVLSRTFQFEGQKKFIDKNMDESSSIKAGLQFAKSIGTQPASVVPDTFDANTTYENFVSRDITPFIDSATKIPGYTYVLPTFTEIASAIYKYGGVAARYVCGESWYTDVKGNVTWDPARILPLRDPINPTVGHAIVLTGYDTSTQEFTIRNSWSDKWALNGNGYAIYNQYAPTEAYAILSETPVIPKVLIFNQQMGVNSVGAQVMLLQQTLVAGGYGNFTPTGFFGPKTKQAVINYQKAHNILTTGYVGPLTLASLNSLH